MVYMYIDMHCASVYMHTVACKMELVAWVKAKLGPSACAVQAEACRPPVQV